VAQLGLRLHALFAPEEPDAVGRVQALLAARSLKGTVRVAAPSLEDVFVGATMGRH